MMDNINDAKLRRFINEAKDANNVVRALADDSREAVEHKAFTLSRVYTRPVLLEVPLEVFLTWEKDDLTKAKVNLHDVRAAIEACADAAELQQRLAAARTAAAPKLRLAARLLDYVKPKGKWA